MKYHALLLCLALAGCAETARDTLDPPILDAPIADGRWLVINYWAIWCAPCRDEIPELNRFAENVSPPAGFYSQISFILLIKAVSV